MNRWKTSFNELDRWLERVAVTGGVGVELDKSRDRDNKSCEETWLESSISRKADRHFEDGICVWVRRRNETERIW